MNNYKKSQNKANEEIYSNVVRGGKRTYFFDIRETRGKEQYLTITESKKVFDDQGDFRFEKHKIFLYKEDFEKFGDAFSETVSMIKNGEISSNQEITKSDTDDFTNLDFESLGE